VNTVDGIGSVGLIVVRVVYIKIKKRVSGQNLFRVKTSSSGTPDGCKSGP
jgi:hypothetical protein